MHGEIAWLSLPTGQNLATPIAEVRLRPPDNKAASRLIRTLEASYATAVRFESEWPFVEEFLGSNLGGHPPLLLSLNVNVLCGLLAHLGISPPQIVMASSVTQVEGTTARLVEICEGLGITDLVIGTGQGQAVHDLDKLRALGIRIFVHDYLRLHPVYSQARRRARPFFRGLSILDALFNVGASEVRGYLMAPTYAPVALEDDTVKATEGRT